MQGIQEDGYESAEEEFHLTTSGEFCDGASRTRAMPMEELELEELKLWDQEELELSRAQGGAVLAPPAVEVAALKAWCCFVPHLVACPTTLSIPPPLLYLD